MSTAELILALKELPLDERARVVEAALGPLTPEHLAALRLFQDYQPGGALAFDDDQPDDFIDPAIYLPKKQQ